QQGQDRNEVMSYRRECLEEEPHVCRLPVASNLPLLSHTDNLALWSRLQSGVNGRCATCRTRQDGPDDSQRGEPERATPRRRTYTSGRRCSPRPNRPGSSPRPATNFSPPPTGPFAKARTVTPTARRHVNQRLARCPYFTSSESTNLIIMFPLHLPPQRG